MEGSNINGHQGGRAGTHHQPHQHHHQPNQPDRPDRATDRPNRPDRGTRAAGRTQRWIRSGQEGGNNRGLNGASTATVPEPLLFSKSRPWGGWLWAVPHQCQLCGAESDVQSAATPGRVVVERRVAFLATRGAGPPLSKASNDGGAVSCTRAGSIWLTPEQDPHYSEQVTAEAARAGGAACLLTRYEGTVQVRREHEKEIVKITLWTWVVPCVYV